MRDYSLVKENDVAKISRTCNPDGSISEPQPIGFIQAFQLPNVFTYSIAFGFFKLVKQTILINSSLFL